MLLVNFQNHGTCDILRSASGALTVIDVWSMKVWIVGQFGQQISLSAINLYPLYLMVMDNLSREIRGSEKKYTCSSEMGQGLKRMRRQNGHRRLCQSSFQRIQGLHCSRDSNSALGVIIFKLRQLHIKPLNFFIVPSSVRIPPFRSVSCKHRR
ncbi:hypothetical protein BDQ17DRAFT_306144 [Cyathus striatus]|nr:hypothetical protein BDQ17DRAFT_306144 [Cyathus striatus]